VPTLRHSTSAAALWRLCRRIDILEPVDGPINHRIDDAYRGKYRGGPHTGPMIGARPRSASVRVMPRETDSSPTEEQ
jgi:hypothetical protein